MARRNPKSKIQNSKLRKLVPLLLDWFSKNARDLPWRRTRDPYAIWVSEIMLQQTQVKTVIPFWNRWLRELPTIEAAAKAPSQKIHKLWEGLGYYTRVRNLQKAAQTILEKHDGKFPKQFDDVLALSGIGRYTAGAICSIAFNQPTPILDGNVIRVLTRIFGIEKNPREKETNKVLWQIAENLVSHAKAQGSQRKNKNFASFAPLREENSCSHLNQSLMELGALVCTPRNPKCLICPAKKLCVAFQENRVDELPNPGAREKPTARKFLAFVIERNGKFLVQQRPEKVVNAHLWEFPNYEIHLKGSSGRKSAHSKFSQGLLASAAAIKDFGIAQATKEFGLDFQNAKSLLTIKHSITRYRITVEAFHISIKHPRAKNFSKNENWFSLSELDSLAFTSAHRKILKQLEKFYDLDFIIGSWVEDKKFDDAIAIQDRIDANMW
ncbi:MAG TPA: A/G-specific adenine glycosylase [Verrucomicrobiae bacterium]|nr:A/G-specific adenine glycosylase [Verrucomicrobiae bacterium]